MNAGRIIRRLTEEDLPSAAELWLACFTDDDRAFVEYYFRERTAPQRMLGLFVTDGGAERPVSMLCFERRFMCGARGERLKVCFIAGVCTLPQYRRRGYVRLLLDRVYDMMREEGCDALVLQPFDFDFYKKLGFVPFAKIRYYTVKAAPAGDGRLEEPEGEAENDGSSLTDPAPLRPQRLTAELFFKTCAAFMRARYGALERDERRCRAVLGEYSLEGAEALAVQTGSGAAYALFWQAGEDAAEQRLDELCWSDETAAAALTAALTRRFPAVRIPLPAEGEPPAFLLHAGSEEAYFNMIRWIKRPVEGAAAVPFDTQRY